LYQSKQFWCTSAHNSIQTFFFYFPKKFWKWIPNLIIFVCKLNRFLCLRFNFWPAFLNHYTAMLSYRWDSGYHKFWKSWKNIQVPIVLRDNLKNNQSYPKKYSNLWMYPWLVKSVLRFNPQQVNRSWFMIKSHVCNIIQIVLEYITLYIQISVLRHSINHYIIAICSSYENAVLSVPSLLWHRVYSIQSTRVPAAPYTHRTPGPSGPLCYHTSSWPKWYNNAVTGSCFHDFFTLMRLCGELSTQQ
jgi:hypothetical protein